MAAKCVVCDAELHCRVEPCEHGETVAWYCPVCLIVALEEQCAAKDARIREMEDAAQTWKNAWNAACNDIEPLRARLALLKKVNIAFVEELKCYHDGNDGDDVHFCGKCDDHVASADEIRAVLDALKEE